MCACLCVLCVYVCVCLCVSGIRLKRDAIVCDWDMLFIGIVIARKKRSGSAVATQYAMLQLDFLVFGAVLCLLFLFLGGSCFGGARFLLGCPGVWSWRFLGGSCFVWVFGFRGCSIAL